MRVIDINPVNDNPQTAYTIVFGNNVSSDKILNYLQSIAEMREELGLTTKANTLETVQAAKNKLKELNILPA